MKRMFVQKNDPFERAILRYDVVAIRNNQLLYTIDLITLFSDEENLRGGRFANFQHQDQANRVSIPVDVLGGIKGQFARIVEWIAEYSNTIWSFDMRMTSTNQGDIVFSFMDQSVFVAFVLMWTVD